MEIENSPTKFGIANFADYGIEDDSVAADFALEQMLKDKSVVEIHSYTPLSFEKRHKITRNNICFNFHNNLITAKNIEPAKHNDPFGALFHFKGKKHDRVAEVRLTHDHLEQYDMFEVLDSDKFSLYSWWQVRCNNLEGREEREIDKLIMVTEIVDKTHVRFNYRMGWELKVGRILEYFPVEPISNITVKNMRFCGNFGGEEKGIQPIAIEHAVDCDVLNVHGINTYWPVILRRHNTGYRTSRCSLVNPVEVVVGGTGYLTQQIHCLYGSVRDCTTSNARHLNDFTGSAYCSVDNCHGDGDFHGSFVTHGQFEHDLTYTGNSGLLSFANSGVTWGSTAKRINVTRHVGCWGLAFAKVSDLTLQDVAIHKTDAYEECGTLLLNADGLQVKGCTADELILTQSSARSRRPCIIEGCYFERGITIRQEGDTPVSNKIIQRDNFKGDNYE